MMSERKQPADRPTAARRLPALMIFALLALAALPATTLGQWATSGSDISTTNTGNVGVGTSAAPAAKLDVIGPLTGNGPTIRAGGGGDLLLASGGSLFFDGNYSYAAGNYIRPLSANTQSFFTSGVERLRIGATGNVGVGTAAPGYRLHVAGDNTDAGGYPVIKLQNTQAGGHSFWLYSGAAGAPGAFGLYDETAGRYRLFVDSSGNVGVGTTSPFGALHVPTGTVFIGQNTGAGAVLRVGRIDSLYPAIVSASNYSDAANPVFLARSFGPWVAPTGNGVYNFLGINSDTTRTFSADYAGNGYFAGNVGIGTTTPQKALDVAGDVNASGTITGGNIQAKFQDVAEWVPATKLLPAGTVVVLDPSHNNQVTSSAKAYDTRVAGVVSPQPGISLGERGEGRALVATTGRVRVKADATRAPIAVGDLLVTSDVEGAAMKSVPVNLGGVEIHRPGTIIGKALEPLEKGTGEILVLLSLQ